MFRNSAQSPRKPVEAPQSRLVTAVRSIMESELTWFDGTQDSIDRRESQVRAAREAGNKIISSVTDEYTDSEINIINILSYLNRQDAEILYAQAAVVENDEKSLPVLPTFSIQGAINPYAEPEKPSTIKTAGVNSSESYDYLKEG